MTFAVISDIHSNSRALVSVLEDIKHQNVEQIYCLGDLIGYAPDPNKIFPLIKKKKIQTILGNYDEAVSYEKNDCGCGYSDEKCQLMGKVSFDWTVKKTNPDNKEWMKTLPREIRFTANSKRILMVHGSSENISERIEPDISDEDLNLILDKAKAEILFCGHTHWPFHKIVNGRHIINPGSVGRPRIGSPQANYAVVDIQKGCTVRFRFVDYDYESFAQEIENSPMPKNPFAEAIRTGYWKF
ncbi:metallophosphoesterase family protein [Acidobacteriota bacterium]